MEQLLGYRIYQTNSVVSVRWIQQKLNRIMGSKIKEDGILGDETISLIRKFQKSQNLTPDGIIGPQTLNALMNADPWKNKKVESVQESQYSKVVAVINNVIDALDETFYNNRGLVGLSFFSGSEGVRDLNVGGGDRHYLRKLYEKASNDKAFLENKIKTMPKPYVDLDKDLNKTKNTTTKLQIQKQMEIIRINHLRETSASLRKSKNIADNILKVKNVGTTLSTLCSKIMAFLKPLGKIFKVIDWSSVVVYIKKGYSFFADGRWIDGYKYLCKAFSKVLEICIAAIVTESVVAGTVALCATAGLGAVATALAALAATVAVAVVIFCVSYLWECFINWYYDKIQYI